MTIQADLPLNSQDVPSFQSFLRHWLPQRVEDELRSIIQERFQPIEDDLRNTLDIAGIVETHVEELTRSWWDRGSPTGLLGETLPEQNDDIFLGDHSYPALPAPTWEAEANLLTESIPDVLDRGNGLLDHPSPGNLGDIAVNDQLWDFLPVPLESDMSEHTEQFEGQYRRLSF